MTRRRELHELFTPEPNTGCWLFLGYIDRNGYGQIRRDRRTRPAHLVVYEMVIGRVASEDIDHTCRVRSCVNPAHLEPVTHRENMRRGHGFAGLNARKTHCLRGHEFTEANTVAHGRGNRNCRACVSVRRAEAHTPRANGLTPSGSSASPEATMRGSAYGVSGRAP